MNLRVQPAFRAAEFNNRRRLRHAVLPLLAVLALTTAQCSKKGSHTASPATLKCISRLKSIRELAAITESGGIKQVEDGGRPLEGVKVALTFSGSLKSDPDPNADADDVCYMQNTVENEKRLIQTLKNNGLPPTVDFINGTDFDARIADLWLQSGNLIGNMSFGPRGPRRNNGDEFVSAVAKMDQTLEPLLKKYPQKSKYFRYPHLKPSKKQEIREREESAIAKLSYRVVPATITGYDQQFASLYCAAESRQDQECANEIKADFFPLLLDSFTRSRRLIGEITGSSDSKQILELKPNQFTIDMLDEWIKRLKRLGVQFIPVDEALSDPLYSVTSKRGLPLAFSLVKKIKREQRYPASTGAAND